MTKAWQHLIPGCPCCILGVHIRPIGDMDPELRIALLAGGALGREVHGVKYTCCETFRVVLRLYNNSSCHKLSIDVHVTCSTQVLDPLSPPAVCVGRQACSVGTA